MSLQSVICRYQNQLHLPCEVHDLESLWGQNRNLRLEEDEIVGIGREEKVLSDRV